MRYTHLLRPMMALALMCAMPAAANPLEHQLNQKYHAKVYLLRHFYINGKLHFDADGALLGKSEEGPWTLARVEIKSIKLADQGVQLVGNRLAGVFDSRTWRFRWIRLADQVHVDLDMPPGDVTADAITKMLDTIFIADSEDLGKHVPAYWCAFLRNFPNHGRWEPSSPAQPLPDCGMGRPQVFGGTTDNTAGKVRTTAHGDADADDPIYKVGGKVNPPRALITPDPDYEPIARGAAFEGTSILWVVVDREGKPSNIQVVRPAGFGLDDRAVEAVSRWRFAPAKRDGQPVAVQINVEVNFTRR